MMIYHHLVNFLFPSLSLSQEQKEKEHEEMDDHGENSKNNKNPSSSSSYTSSQKHHHQQPTQQPIASSIAGSTSALSSAITIQAIPGLVTFLDVSLHRSYEGQVSATLCSTFTLLQTFLQLKVQSAQLLYILSTEGYTTLATAISTAAVASLNEEDLETHRKIQQVTATVFKRIQTCIQAILEYTHQTMELITTDPLSIATHYIPSSTGMMNHTFTNSGDTLQQQQKQHESSISFQKQNSKKNSTPLSSSSTTTAATAATTTPRSHKNKNNIHNNSNTHSNNSIAGSVEESYHQYIQSILDVPLLHENGQRIVTPTASHNNTTSSTTTHSFIPSIWNHTTTKGPQHHPSTKQSQQQQQQQQHGRTRNTTHGGGGEYNIPTISQQDGSTTTTTTTTTYYRSYSRMDCWESCRLYCFDYIWAQEVYTTSCKYLRFLLQRQELLSMYIQQLGGGGGVVTSSISLQEKQNILWNLLVLGEDDGSIDTSTTWTTLLSTSPCLEFLYKTCLPLLSYILSLFIEDIPQHWTTFKCSMEINAIVLKRMYLIKNEYRAPFRAFLESHVHIQRMPCISVVDSYLNTFVATTTATSTIPVPQRQEEDEQQQQDDEVVDYPLLWIQKKREAERKLQEAIQNPILVEALEIEKACEELEMEMSQMVLPFGELSRFLESKGGHVRVVENVVSIQHVPYLEELLRRLTFLLVPKKNNPPSSGIRQILLDLQGLKRDTSLSMFEMDLFGTLDNLTPREAASERVKVFLNELSTLCTIAQMEDGFYFVDKKETTNVPISLLKACTTNLDAELFQAQFEDWYDLLQRQGELIISHQANATVMDESTAAVEHSSTVFQDLSEVIRQAEMELSIAMAPYQAIATVRQKLEQVENDRIKKFHVLREILQDVCLREMDLQIDLVCPDKQSLLRLPEMPSALGIFGVLLQSHGELLPL